MSVVNCPYCGADAKLRDAVIVYGNAGFGLAWVCARFPACDSYVGCHPGTNTPLGRMANKELRLAKGRAHAAFDRLWQAKMRKESGISKSKARGAGYRWLSVTLGIDPRNCHIGMMDVETCNRVVEACEPFHANRRTA